MFIKTYSETKDWLDKIGIRKYEINKDTLVVDVDDDVDLSNKNLNHISVKFGEVSGWFYVHGNQNLESLIGCPDSTTGIYCTSTGIKNFNGVNYTKYVVAYQIASLESFEGLPNELEILDIWESCDNIRTLEHFPKIINDCLTIGSEFKLLDIIYRHMESCNTVKFIHRIESYNNILKLLYVKGIKSILSVRTTDMAVYNTLNAEIQRQPDPRKRNLLKVAQELSNAGFHHLTV